MMERTVIVRFLKILKTGTSLALPVDIKMIDQEKIEQHNDCWKRLETEQII